MGGKYESPVSQTLGPVVRREDVVVHFISWLPESGSSGENYCSDCVAKEP